MQKRTNVENKVKVHLLTGNSNRLCVIVLLNGASNKHWASWIDWQVSAYVPYPNVIVLHSDCALGIVLIDLPSIHSFLFAIDISLQKQHHVPPNFC